MFEPLRVCLVGATGLVGWQLIEKAVGHTGLRIVAIARREVRLPPGARMTLVVAELAEWTEAITKAKANVLVCALGTTWRKAGKDEAAFRAVDFDLVLACAREAKAAGTQHMIVVSSVGADANSRNFFLRVKGETEAALGKLGFRRLDILRPGLLRGPRGDDRRIGERLAIRLSPLCDILLHGKRRRYRSIHASQVALAIIALAKEKAAGRFFHDNDAMLYALRRRGG
jgi:uncharacterized protein YbjT (DUF2867 family)